MARKDSVNSKSNHLKDGSPEPFAQWFGDEFEKVRTRRKLSRSAVALELMRILYADNVDNTSALWKACSVDFLKRLAQGRVVKITRELVNALCRALKCTPQERDTILLHADRNVLTNGTSAPTPVQELYNQVISARYRAIEKVLGSALRVEPPCTFRDMEDLVDEAWDLVRKARDNLEDSERH